MGSRVDGRSASRAGDTAHGTGEPVDAAPRRHPWRWVSALVVLFLVYFLGSSVVTNPNMHWEVVRKYVFDSYILTGLLRTVELTAAAMAIAIGVGVITAMMRMSDNRVLASVSWLYVWFLRGTPILVQLLFWYFLAALFPTISLGIPYGPTFVSFNTNTVIGQFSAAILGLGLSEAAYMSEIVRAGILSVPAGQLEAAESLGMTHAQAMRRIVLPQAMKVIIPPTGNATISMLKMTSLVLVIALPDLLTSAQLIYSRNFLQIPLLTVACVWYLVVTSLLTVAQHYIERHYSRGSVNRRREAGPRAWRRQRPAIVDQTAATTWEHM